MLGLVSQLINPSRLNSVSIIVQPTTLLNFHPALVKRKYRILFSRRTHKQPGPKRPSRELINAIVDLKQRNPRYGCPRIAETITLTFGILVNKDMVRRVLAKHYKPGSSGNKGPSWLTFLGYSKDSLWSIDFFRCESLTPNSYWVLVVMDQWNRRTVGFGVHHGSVEGISLCRMFNQVTSGADPPCYRSSDNDPLFSFHRWKANLRVLEVKEVKSVPYTPISHPFIERLIDTIRREYLDQMPFWNSLDLQRKLDQFKTYYNEHERIQRLAA
jgi:transposase InsO family protein